jgi:purine-binding chemotaxis protein CheW
LILASNSIDEQFAILRQTTPTLENIPIFQIRLLPDSYRRTDTLELASHVTMVPQGENTLTAFVINVDRLVPPIQLRDFVFLAQSLSTHAMTKQLHGQTHNRPTEGKE